MNAEVYRKNDLTIGLTVKDENNTALPLTNCTIFFYVATPVAIEKSLGNGITVTDANAGTIDVVLSHEDMDQAPGTYKTELLVIDSGGKRYTAMVGSLSIVKNLSS